MTTVLPGRALERLIYFSTFSPLFPQDGEAQDEEIRRIILSSIRNNSGIEVTGLLVVYQRWFIQVLEGSADAIKTIYRRIQSDTRHQDLTVIGVAAAKVRQFPHWNMCARRLSITDNAILQTLDIKAQFDPRLLTPLSAMTFLTAVKEIQSHRS